MTATSWRVVTLVQRQIQRFGGRLLDSASNGALILCDVPAHAIAAGRAHVRDEARRQF